MWFMPVDLQLIATTTARFTAVHIIVGSKLTAYNKRTEKSVKKKKKDYGIDCISQSFCEQHAFVSSITELHFHVNQSRQ